MIFFASFCKGTLPVLLRGVMYMWEGLVRSERTACLIVWARQMPAADLTSWQHTAQHATQLGGSRAMGWSERGEVVEGNWRREDKEQQKTLVRGRWLRKRKGWAEKGSNFKRLKKEYLTVVEKDCSEKKGWLSEIYIENWFINRFMILNIQILFGIFFPDYWTHLNISQLWPPKNYSYRLLLSISRRCPHCMCLEIFLCFLN